VAPLTEVVPNLAQHQRRLVIWMVDRDSAPRWARRWGVQSDVGNLAPSTALQVLGRNARHRCESAGGLDFDGPL
ncbi:MAG: hypothetical protein ABL962_19840, partial [Fimbriimonadaceae bacterium]